jgi:hypothetical protein
MNRILVLACAGLSFGLLASPLAAQQLAEQAVQSTPAPPLPPNPSAKPSSRWVDVGGPRTARAPAKASPARHAASVKRDSKAHATSKSRSGKKDRPSRTASKSHKAPSSKATASRRHGREDKPMHFSSKTIRSCHAMTYRQIMRNSSCRAMIKQELAAPDVKPRAKHQASAHRKAASHAKTARNHSTTKRRGR